MEVMITAGRGPTECEIAVSIFARRMIADAVQRGLCDEKEVPGRAQSFTFSIKHDPLFVETWKLVPNTEVTYLWECPSPVRPNHRRKKWFVGVILRDDETQMMKLDESKLRWETFRASGKGGQHVNKTESAVRVTCLTTGLSASSQDERSQHANKKVALERLRKLVERHNQIVVANDRQEGWNGHNMLERGNPVITLVQKKA